MSNKAQTSDLTSQIKQNYCQQQLKQSIEKPQEKLTGKKKIFSAGNQQNPSFSQSQDETKNEQNKQLTPQRLSQSDRKYKTMTAGRAFQDVQQSKTINNNSPTAMIRPSSKGKSSIHYQKIKNHLQTRSSKRSQQDLHMLGDFFIQQKSKLISAFKDLLDSEEFLQVLFNLQYEFVKKDSMLISQSSPPQTKGHYLSPHKVYILLQGKAHTMLPQSPFSHVLATSNSDIIPINNSNNGLNNDNNQMMPDTNVNSTNFGSEMQETAKQGMKIDCNPINNSLQNYKKATSLSVGDHFCDIALDYNLASEEVLYCETDCEFASLDQASYTKCVGNKYKEFLQDIITKCLMKFELFQSANLSFLRLMAEKAEKVILQQGYQLFKINQQADYIYFIEEGEVLLTFNLNFLSNLTMKLITQWISQKLNLQAVLQMTVDDQRKIFKQLTLGPYNCFGEDGILLQQQFVQKSINMQSSSILRVTSEGKRLMNAVTISPCVLYRVKKDCFLPYYIYMKVIQRQSKNITIQNQLQLNQETQASVQQDQLQKKLLTISSLDNDNQDEDEYNQNKMQERYVSQQQSPKAIVQSQFVERKKLMSAGNKPQSQANTEYFVKTLNNNFQKSNLENQEQNTTKSFLKKRKNSRVNSGGAWQGDEGINEEDQNNKGPCVGEGDGVSSIDIGQTDSSGDKVKSRGLNIYHCNVRTQSQDCRGTKFFGIEKSKLNRIRGASSCKRSATERDLGNKKKDFFLTQNSIQLETENKDKILKMKTDQPDKIQEQQKVPSLQLDKLRAKLLQNLLQNNPLQEMPINNEFKTSFKKSAFMNTLYKSNSYYKQSKLQKEAHKKQEISSFKTPLQQFSLFVLSYGHYQIKGGPPTLLTMMNSHLNNTSNINQRRAASADNNQTNSRSFFNQYGDSSQYSINPRTNFILRKQKHIDKCRRKYMLSTDSSVQQMNLTQNMDCPANQQISQNRFITSYLGTDYDRRVNSMGNIEKNVQNSMTEHLIDNNQCLESEMKPTNIAAIKSSSYCKLMMKKLALQKLKDSKVGESVDFERQRKQIIQRSLRNKYYDCQNALQANLRTLQHSRSNSMARMQSGQVTKAQQIYCKLMNAIIPIIIFLQQQFQTLITKGKVIATPLLKTILNKQQQVSFKIPYNDSQVVRGGRDLPIKRRLFRPELSSQFDKVSLD